jgi:endonuclease G
VAGPVAVGAGDGELLAAKALAASGNIGHPVSLPPGPVMPSRLLCTVRLALALLALCAAWSARAGGCDSFFADGQPPVLLDAKLAQRTTPLCNEAYAALASGITRGSLWSAERLTAQGLAGAQATAREGRFHEEERLPVDDRALLSDYTRSGYDRGHMTPSGDMPDAVAQQQSFSLANVVPQAPALNRGVWEGIEGAVRRLADRQGTLYVVTGPAFQGTQLRSLKGRVLVPTATWKAIYDPDLGGAAAYHCTNVSRPKCAYLSIAALERETGIDPFPAVPNTIKQVAMRLPAPEPNPYGHQRHAQHHSLFTPLFQ